MQPLAFFDPMEHQMIPWIEQIIQGALQVLECKGMQVPYDELRQRLAAVAGMKVDGAWVRFKADYTNDFLTRYRAAHPFTSAADFRLYTGMHAHHIVDFNGKIRPMHLADVEMGACLSGALVEEGIVAGAQGVPQDVPPLLQPLAQLITVAKNKPGYPDHVPGAAETNVYLTECIQVMGFSHGISVHTVSPLKFEGQEVEAGLERHQRMPQSEIGIGTMPILGMSAPASPLAGFVIAFAEVVAGGMIFEALGASVKQIGLGVNAYPFDMRFGSFIYGCPSNLVCTLIERALNRWLGTEGPAKTFSCMAQMPGPHACAQKAVFTGMMASLGKKMFSAGGSLSIDEVFSPIQLIYDREIFRYVTTVNTMMDAAFQPDMLMINEIIDNASGSYMDAESTAGYFKRFQWDSNVFPSRMLAQWEMAGKPAANEVALSEINHLLDNYDYTLAPDKSRALDAIYQRASRDLLK